MKIRNLAYMFLCFSVCVAGASAAQKSKGKTSKQSAIQNGTTVRTKVEAKGIYDQECYDAYYGCMDQFCITDNSNGGSCACSDDSEKYEKELASIQETLDEAERIRTIEVEKVKAGAQADIIFTGTREYDKDGNVVSVDQQINSNSSGIDAGSWFNNYNDDDDDDEYGADDDDITNKKGSALFKAAEDVCVDQLPDKCDKEMKFLHQLYSRQIVSDCKGFANVVAEKRKQAKLDLASAQGEVRTALKESFDSANKYDLGQCMIEFKKCMQGEDACGKDWENCVAEIASENMQRSTNSTDVSTYGFATSTMERLNTKRTICEHVLNECLVVRDMVWPAFLKEAAPVIKLAEQQAESNMRQSCLTNITNCLHKACKEDIADKGVASMDACLTRPTMVEKFCKNQIDPCMKMEGVKNSSQSDIMGYVKDRLAAMRVDSCTQAVKDCITDNTRCGPDFSNCIGMDFDFITSMCPADSDLLVACKKNGNTISQDDLDKMVMGLYLNIDNSQLAQCQNLVEKKMTEICGSTTDCNRFASDDTIGTGSLKSQKDKDVYRVTGMISFGSIKVLDTDKRWGEIDVSDYISEVKKLEKNSNIPNSEGIISSITEELHNIEGTVNRTITMIGEDPQIKFCIEGRDLSQITGDDGASTKARFPNLLHQIKLQITLAALRQAQDNYNAKLNQLIADATKDASADVAQFMCQMLPHNNGLGTSALDKTGTGTMSEPYAISYDVATGVSSKAMTRISGASKDTIEGSSLSLRNLNIKNSGTTREMRSTFNRTTRVCHFCTTTISQECHNERKTGFWGIGAKQISECKEAQTTEKCEDIEM